MDASFGRLIAPRIECCSRVLEVTLDSRRREYYTSEGRLETGGVKAAEFLSLRGLQPEGFLDGELADHPDFRVFKRDTLVFFCEVRSVAKDGRQGTARRSGRADLAVRVLGTERVLTCTDRMSNHISAAIERFDGVNSRRHYPNVLILINDDILCGFNDLVAVATGLRARKSEYPVYPRYSLGQPTNENVRIDLYIWLDENKPPQFFFNRDSEAHLRKLCDCFGLKPELLRKV